MQKNSTEGKHWNELLTAEKDAIFLRYWCQSKKKWSELEKREKDEIANKNEGWIINNAKRLLKYRISSLENVSHLDRKYILDEAIQSGKYGLMEAATRYEPVREIPFWSFAKMYVKKAIDESLKKNISNSPMNHKSQISDNDFFDNDEQGIKKIIDICISELTGATQKAFILYRESLDKGCPLAEFIHDYYPEENIENIRRNHNRAIDRIRKCLLDNGIQDRRQYDNWEE